MGIPLLGLDGLCSPPPFIEHDPPQRTIENSTQELALHSPFKWGDRRELHVSFLGGDMAVQQVISGIITGFEGWNSACGVQFVFGKRPDADIRISFVKGASWSYVGSQSKGMPMTSPTMNFGWLERSTPYMEIRRVSLHEFGHALGFIHEHASPLADIPWDVAKVYDYYLRTNGWLPYMVDAQVLAKYDPSVVEQESYDPHSIMHYLIPPFLLTDPSAVLGGNTVLSSEDRRKAADWYGEPPVRWTAQYIPVVLGE